MKKVGNIIIWVAVLAILIIGAYVVYNRSDSEEYIEDKIAGDIDGDINKDGTADNKDGGTEEENKIMAPDFTLKDLDGNTVKLSDYRGKIVFLNFWASWCGPCTSEMPEFEEVHKEFSKGDDAIILTVNLTDGFRETEEKARKFIADNGYTMKVLLDTTGNVAQYYGIYSIPTTYVINRDGSLVTYMEGATRGKVLLDILEKLK
ncbi:MAG TPA: TlpA disulfide reductase family protein [Acetivibrio sp.]|uniref:TlpA family protein disulfide reductase n=1 Tax=Acetivibrio sp. TaxID=1872092 RepID=UPI002CE6927E|nr:TlpA disulfide reductase family protein [Acetivibrio sp.]HOM02835.1 TlpA disulfide reductase family protein [Acetivibrio sp.]